MGAGGSVEANIDRWYAQFTQPDGGSSKDREGQKEARRRGSGSSPRRCLGNLQGSARPDVARRRCPKYRMLERFIATKAAGNYFIKLYGPEQTMAENEVVGMIEGMKAK